MKRKISACALLFALEFVDVASAEIISGPCVAVVETEEFGSSSVEDIYDSKNSNVNGNSSDKRIIPQGNRAKRSS